MMEQAKISAHLAMEFRYWRLAFIIGRKQLKRAMLHQPLDSAPREQASIAPRKKRRRLFGLRELLLLVVAFALLALLPTTAQFGKEAPLEIKDGLTSIERPSANFPGSAFYFIDTTEIAASTARSDIATADMAYAANQMPSYSDGAIIAKGPYNPNAAQPFVLQPSSPDYLRALKCLSDALYYEAANEPEDGLRGVAQVILNRARHPSYPNTVCGVIYQGSERTTGCQFSYACDGSMARMPARPAWLRAQRIAMQALAGYVHMPVGTATHYHANYVYPYWAPSLNYITTIGAHRFYSFSGSAGRGSAFFRRYAGSEPFPGPKPRTWTPSAKGAPDPIQLQKQYEKEYAALRAKAEQDAIAAARNTYSANPAAASSGPEIGRQRPPSVPAYAAPAYSREAQAKGGEANYGGGKLPNNGNIKPEFQNSGTWKAQPTG